MNNVKAYVRLLRPYQWTKNGFIFAALIFSKHLFDREYAVTSFIAFAAFSLLSSVVYIINDIADRESDRAHPVKKLRPIASGRIGIPAAVVVAVLLGVIVVLLLRGLDERFAKVVAIYFLLNLAYSFKLKHIVLLDIFIVAAGFMLRVVAGAYVINVFISDWLVLCTLFVSVFLALSKRRGELVLIQETKNFEGRPVLKGYDVALIDQFITIAASAMAISYALYTVAERTVAMFGTEKLIFTTVFVLFGIFRFMQRMKQRGTADNPTTLLLSDPIMLVNVGAWLATCILVIYAV